MCDPSLEDRLRLSTKKTGKATVQNSGLPGCDSSELWYGFGQNLLLGCLVAQQWVKAQLPPCLSVYWKFTGDGGFCQHSWIVRGASRQRLSGKDRRPFARRPMPVGNEEVYLQRAENKKSASL